MCQDNDGLMLLIDIVKWVKRNYPTKNIWCYTGYVYEDLKDLQKILANNCDVIVDGPYIEEKRDIAHCPFRGSTNQRIIHINKND